jgi:glycosyltransferase involved in cell wall biosynthesis
MHPLLLPSTSAAQLVTIHDLDFLDHPDRTQAEIRRDYAPLVASHAARADRVVVVSKDTAQAVESRLGVPASKISLCMPGAPEWTAREREPAESGIILFLGTLEPRKNIGVLLDAYERLVSNDPSAPRLVLAGRATPAFEPLLTRIRRPPLASRVDLPGYIDEASKRTLFDRALVFVLPSHAEGFGIPAVEAMQAGIPVIAAQSGALPEVIGPAGRFFDPSDSVMLASILTEVLSSSNMRQRMTDAGLARAKAFTWKDTAHSLREAWHLARTHRAERRG